MNREVRATVVSFTIATTLTLLGSIAAQEIEIRGQVVDEAGVGVSGVRVATGWIVADGLLKPSRPVESGDDGRFSLQADFRRAQPISLSVFDPENQMGASRIVTIDESSEEIALTMVPLVRVHGTLSAPPGHEAVSGSIGVMHAEQGTARVFSVRFSGGSFEFWLPPGQYSFGSYLGRLHESETYGIEIDASATHLDLGQRTVIPNALGKMQGQPAAAWTVTTARQMPADLAGPADRIGPDTFRGRWVVMEFWGWW